MDEYFWGIDLNGQKKCFKILWLSIASASILGMSGCASQQPAQTPEQWQTVARLDLDLAHKLIVEVHPGMLDEKNPDFKKWVESGYQEALALIPGVFSYDTALSAVWYYTFGFRDGHLVYSDNIRNDSAQIVTTGWRVDLSNGDYRVTALAPTWPSALPPRGAKLIECDGRTPEMIIQQDVAPFVDHRNLAATRKNMARSMMILHSSGMQLGRCQFQVADATVLDLSVSYQGATLDQFIDWFIPPSEVNQSQRTNDFEFNDGVLWIHAASFLLNKQDVLALESMLAALRDLKGVKTIVFDSRGNRGGDSSVGTSIFDAATGGLAFDLEGVEKLPPIYAQWRVSDVSIASAAKTVSERTTLYGRGSEQAVYFQKHLEELQVAKREGKQWIEQPVGNLMSRQEVANRGGHLLQFQGKVALITDMNCASACLDFADYVRLVPGAVHVGQVTSADSVYIDTTRLTLPSGNGLIIPLKVWRNRMRGNNEALVPDVLIDLDSLDESSIKAQVLVALKTAPK